MEATRSRDHGVVKKGGCSRGITLQLARAAARRCAPASASVSWPPIFRFGTMSRILEWPKSLTRRSSSGDDLPMPRPWSSDDLPMPRPWSSDDLPMPRRSCGRPRLTRRRLRGHDTPLDTVPRRLRSAWKQLRQRSCWAPNPLLRFRPRARCSRSPHRARSRSPRRARSPSSRSSTFPS
jgi:hypothetical protein